MARTTKIITEAYCEELGRNLTIKEAHEEYFKQNLPRKRFTFRCSDPKCRQELNPEVIGRNYSKTKVKLAPCYAEKFGDPHIQDCIWVKGDADKKRGRKAEKKPVKKIRFEFGKTSKNPSPISRPVSPVGTKDWSEFSEEDLTSKRGVTIYSSAVKVSHDFFELIEAYRHPADYPTCSQEVTIFGENYTFRQIFKHLTMAKDWHSWPHIYWGEGAIYNYKSKKEFCVFFNDVKKFSDEHAATPCRMYIPYSQLSTPSYEGLFGQLKLASDASNKRRTFYAFGEFSLEKATTSVGEEGNILVFTPKSLRDFVMIE